MRASHLSRRIWQTVEVVQNLSVPEGIVASPPIAAGFGELFHGVEVSRPGLENDQAIGDWLDRSNDFSVQMKFEASTEGRCPIGGHVKDAT